MIHHLPAVSRRTVLGTAAALPAAGLAAACSGQASPTGPSVQQPVRVLTGLGFQGREAYLDVAIAKGWFAEAGLEVEVLPGDGTDKNLTLLAEETAEFATLDVSGALIEYSKGEFTDFRLTSVLHESNLSCVMVLGSSAITSFADLEGKTVAAIPGGVNTVVLPLLAELVGFNADRVQLVYPDPRTFGSLLAAGSVGGIMQFVVGQAAIETAAQQPVRVLAYSQWITDVYGSGIGVTAELAQRDPDLVRRFNRAAIRGMEYAIANPDEAAEVFASRHEEQDPVVAAGELRALADYVRPGSGFSGPLQLGEISTIRLSKNIAVLESLGAVEPGIAAEDVAVFGLAR